MFWSTESITKKILKDWATNLNPTLKIKKLPFNLLNASTFPSYEFTPNDEYLLSNVIKINKNELCLIRIEEILFLATKDVFENSLFWKFEGSIQLLLLAIIEHLIRQENHSVH